MSADLFATGDIDFDEEPVGVPVVPLLTFTSGANAGVSSPIDNGMPSEMPDLTGPLAECGCPCDYCKVGQHCLGIEGPCTHVEDRTDGQAALFSEGWSDAPREFPLLTEFIETEHECPKCHYKWSGSSR